MRTATVRLRPLVDHALTFVLVASALAVATVAVRREFFPRTAVDSGRAVAGARALASARDPLLGRADAQARVVLFSDYQCPYCRDLDHKLRAALRSLGGRFAVVRYDLPLARIHSHAHAAAIAARCATALGAAERFDSLLFARDLDAPGFDFPALARLAGVADQAAFDTCMKEASTARAVDADVALAHSLGIEGVPAIIVDGKLYSGTMEQGTLESLLAEAL